MPNTVQHRLAGTSRAHYKIVNGTESDHDAVVATFRLKPTRR